jgi:hypothetical protein
MYITPWFMRMFTCFDDWDLVIYTFDFVVANGKRRRPFGPPIPVLTTELPPSQGSPACFASRCR